MPLLIVFQGTCNYTYVETCGKGVPVWFRLTARHKGINTVVAVIQQINVQTQACGIHVDENLQVVVCISIYKFQCVLVNLVS